MEPLDPTKNLEGTGRSKRRISSILKTPRNSVITCDPEKQENEMQTEKQLGKRNSRRVSFAPANDVLLFSKDITNASSTRNPLQELMTAAAVTINNRAHLQDIEDKSHQIIGIEHLLNAPLHLSQQQTTVNFDCGNDVGEKTVVFSSEDAFMDMTHSHTINIAGDVDILGDSSTQNFDILLPGGEKKVTVDDKSNVFPSSRTIKESQASSIFPERTPPPFLDPCFESFLASLSKHSGSNSEGETRSMPSFGSSSEGTRSKAQSAGVDKENLIPNHLSSSRKVSESLHRNTLVSEDDDMDMTEIQTDRIPLVFDDDDPFQCLFPTKDMYDQPNEGKPRTVKKEPENRRKSSLSSEQKEKKSVINPPVSISDESLKVCYSSRNTSREKSVMLAADDDFMEMTQSHTVNIASSSSAPQMTRGFVGPQLKDFTANLRKASNLSDTSAIIGHEHPRDPVNTESMLQDGTSKADIDHRKSPLSLSKCEGAAPSDEDATCCEGDVSMDMTDVQTGHLIEGEAQMGCSVEGTRMAHPFVIPSQEMQRACESQENMEVTSGQQNGMEASLKPSSMPMNRYQEKDVSEKDAIAKTVQYPSDAAQVDVTQMGTDMKPESKQKDDQYGEKTVTYGLDDATMDMTQCLTVNIDSNVVFESVTSVGTREDPLEKMSSSTHNSNPDVNFSILESKQSGFHFDPFRGLQNGPEQDISMNMIEAPTGCDVGMTITKGPIRHSVEISKADPLLPTQRIHRPSCHLKEVTIIPGQQETKCEGAETTPITSLVPVMDEQQFESEHDNKERTVNFAAVDAGMDITQSHTVNIATHLPPHALPNMDLTAVGEKTMRFDLNDAPIEITRSHTVNISRHLNMLDQNMDVLPGNGERTIRFSNNDAPMDVTKSHTVNISAGFNLTLGQNEIQLPVNTERTVRFNMNDANMDVTKSHTVNIAADLNMISEQNVILPSANGERMTRFATSNMDLEETQRHTVNIAYDLNRPTGQNRHTLPADGEKTLRFNMNDANMEVTKSHTVNISADFNVMSDQNKIQLPANTERTVRFNVNDANMEVTKSHTTDIAAVVHEIVKPVMFNEKTIDMTTTDAAMDLEQSLGFAPQMASLDVTSNASAESVQNENFLPSSGDKTLRFLPDDASMDVTHCHTVNIVSNQTECVLSVGEIPPMQDDVAHTVRNRGKSGPFQNVKEFQEAKCAEAETSYSNELKPLNSGAKSCDLSSRPLSSVADEPQKQTQSNSGSVYIAEQKLSKLESSDQMTSSKEDDCGTKAKDSASTDEAAVKDHLTFIEVNEMEASQENPALEETSLLSQKGDCSPGSVKQNVETQQPRTSGRLSLADIRSKVKRLSHLMSTTDAVGQDPNDGSTQPVAEQEVEMTPGKTDAGPEAKSPTEAEQDQMPIKSPKAKRLMSRLSVRGFKPKLPQRNCPKECNKSAGEPTKTFTINVTHQFQQFDNDVSDIHDEELGSCEDLSGMLDSRTPERASRKQKPVEECNRFSPLEEKLFVEEVVSSGLGQKRPLPEDENWKEDEKRLKACTEVVETVIQPDAEFDGSLAASQTQTTDSNSSSHTGSRCEAASESTVKRSLFESQLECYSSKGQKKLEDGSITVSEFFSLFHIDFINHNSRQSVIPGRRLSDATPLDLLRNRHINHPKRIVYEADFQTLSEKVEGLKVQTWNLDKPLKDVNRSLWEDMRNFSEQELKAFGDKIKQRNNFFRKQSKVKSHEMKEVLYSTLVQVNLEEQQKLRGTIGKADEMMDSLDACISELEAELSAVEKGFSDKPSLKSLQEAMSTVTENMSESERQICELEELKTQNSSKLKKLKAETRHMEDKLDVLNMMNEWRLGKKRENLSVYTFLYETMFLELTFENANGNESSSSDKKITNITFKFELHEQRSCSHAGLVHKLLSQFAAGESAWVEKYPTSGHVPMLLHDVSLVVNRCRMLGEELRLLRLWGSLRFDILDLSYKDTRIHVVFSSLKKLTKFEVVFSVRLINQVCVFQVQSLKSRMGNATIEQVEEVVASLTPTKKLFTKIVQSLHETLLS